jgi:hypothetical protein
MPLLPDSDCPCCSTDKGRCTCTEPCESVVCQQFAAMCGTWPSGREYHVFEPQPCLTLEQLRHWKVAQASGPCLCGKRVYEP